MCTFLHEYSFEVGGKILLLKRKVFVTETEG